jgi:hypothetical protein
MSAALDWFYAASPCASPPSPPHIVAGPPRDTVGYRSPSTVSEHHRFPTVEPPHHRWSISVSPNTSKIAQRVAPSSLVLTPSTLPSGRLWQTHPGRVVARGGRRRARSAAPAGKGRTRWFGLWVRLVVQGLGTKPAQHCAATIFHFSFSFMIKLLKYVENMIRLWKNMK